MSLSNDDRLRVFAGQRRDWLARASESFAADDRVMAAWLVGSLARHAGDLLSDVDIVCVLPDHLAGHAMSSTEDLARFGALRLVNHAGQNAPSRGHSVDVLYELGGLPLWVDLHLWPRSWATRPMDAVTLYEEHGCGIPDATASFEKVVDARPRRSGMPQGPAERAAFRLMMVSIAAKYVARRKGASRLLELAGSELVDRDASGALSELWDLLARLRGQVGDGAWRCVANQVELVNVLLRDDAPRQRE